jgi:hypothetical protein
MVVVIVATLIAAAVADNFDAPRAWWIVGVIATGYIVSRGLRLGGARVQRVASPPGVSAEGRPRLIPPMRLVLLGLAIAAVVYVATSGRVIFLPLLLLIPLAAWRRKSRW